MSIAFSLVACLLALSSVTVARPADDAAEPVYCAAVVMPTSVILAESNDPSVANLQLNSLWGRPLPGSRDFADIDVSYYLLQDGTAVLTSEGLRQSWNFHNGGLGYPWCPTQTWLNIAPSNGPWRPLKWAPTQETGSWQAGYAQNLTANTTAQYAQTPDFIACKPTEESSQSVVGSLEQSPYWVLFLQTDPNATPMAQDDTFAAVQTDSCGGVIPSNIDVLSTPLKIPISIPGNKLSPLTIPTINNHIKAVYEAYKPIYEAAIRASTIPTVLKDEEARRTALEGYAKSIAPSLGAKLSEWSSLQRHDPILNGRPDGLTGPPIALFHPVFEDFKRRMDDPTPTDLEENRLVLRCCSQAIYLRGASEGCDDADP
ncbi:hypothetical protein FRB99_003369 [Tulasnella sp. 403]|nr:hypothetical protein FRB99_003369 [Tulasnella sp. 403]